MRPSKAFSVMSERLILGEPMALQQDKDMTEVEAPLSNTVRWMVFPIAFLEIWKAN